MSRTDVVSSFVILVCVIVGACHPHKLRVNLSFYNQQSCLLAAQYRALCSDKKGYWIKVASNEKARYKDEMKSYVPPLNNTDEGNPPDNTDQDNRNTSKVTECLVELLDHVREQEKENKKKRKKTKEIGSEFIKDKRTIQRGRNRIINDATVKGTTIADIGRDIRLEIVSFLSVKEQRVISNVSTNFREVAEEVIQDWINAFFYFDLTESQHVDNELLLERIVVGDNNDILVREGNDSVRRGSLQTLDPGRWLNDEVVNYYLRHPLANRDDNQWLNTDEVTGQQAFYNSFFIQMLFDEKNANLRVRNKYKYKKVAKWGRNFVPGGDIFKLKRLFIPRNISNLH